MFCNKQCSAVVPSHVSSLLIPEHNFHWFEKDWISFLDAQTSFPFFLLVFLFSLISLIPKHHLSHNVCCHREVINMNKSQSYVVFSWFPFLFLQMLFFIFSLQLMVVSTTSIILWLSSSASWNNAKLAHWEERPFRGYRMTVMTVIVERNRMIHHNVFSGYEPQ